MHKAGGVPTSSHNQDNINKVNSEIIHKIMMSVTRRSWCTVANLSHSDCQKHMQTYS